ncbi:hypothetical protein FBR05_01670 [Deltaproteobacteria bacterium PRO3]|nr:hypothetical protein [Deltaproteobacteria bacterium PRO3]
MSPFFILLALLAATPALLNLDRPLQARENPVSGKPSSAQALVEAELVAPLQKKEAKRPLLSRAPKPPSARRVRILDKARHTDAKGQGFLSFEVDETRSFLREEEREVPEEAWRQAAIIGCVYPDSGKVLVKLGETYYPASVLWGNQAEKAPPEACRGLD